MARVGDVGGGHGSALLPGQNVAREVVEHGRQIELDSDRTSNRRWSAGCRTGAGCAAPGNDDCSTSRMISSFSAGARTSWIGHPSVSAFFEQTILHHQFGQQILELMALRPQPFGFVAGRFTCGIAGQPPGSPSTSDSRGWC